MDGLIVVKCGGAAGTRPAAVAADIAALDRPVVLVYGGSHSVDQLADRLGVPQRRLTSPSGVSTRHTDRATLEVLTLALLGQVQTEWLVEFGRHGVSAVALSGLDAGLLRAHRRGAVRAVVDGRKVTIRDDHSGRVVSVNGALLRMLLREKVTPVVSPPALAEDGQPVNANADRIAAAVAAELGADTLVFLTAAPGLLADPSDEATLLTDHVLPPTNGTGPARGGMTMKLIAAREALQAGVGRVVIGEGRVAGPVRRALDGGGTRIRLGATGPPT